MSFLDNLFGRKPKPNNEVEAIFKKIDNLLNNDQMQNSNLLPEIKQLMEQGGAVDEVNSAVGEFGRQISNPIPVNGPIGAITYLSRLLTTSGEKVFFHRLRSKNTIDLYELVSQSGRFWDILFVDMYFTRKSRKIPSGYRSQERTLMLRGTNRYYPDFPRMFHSELTNFSVKAIGMSIADPDAKAISDLRRPPAHEELLIRYS